MVNCRHEHKLLPRKQHQKLRITNSHTFEEEPEREEEEEEEEEASSSQEELAKPGEVSCGCDQKRLSALNASIIF